MANGEIVRRLAVHLSIIVALTGIVSGQRSQAPAATTAILRGRVAASGPGATPIIDARVSLASGPTVVEPVFTDPTGRFEFTGLAAGRYTITAEKSGFVKTRYGARRELDVPQPIDVAPGATVEGVDIKLPKGAAISGRIVDELGDPIVGASVSAGVLRSVGTEARLVKTDRPDAATDDRGEFRIGGLAAGRYYVSVAASQVSAAAAAGAVGWGHTYYPASLSLADATAISLAESEERNGLDFSVLPAQPAKLTLSLADATGAPTGGVINLFLPGDAPESILQNRGVPLSPQGQRMTNTLEPGEWVAVALVREGRSIAHIRLAGGEVSEVTLKVGAGARLDGRVIFEGSTPPPAFTSVRLGIQGVGLDAAAPAPGLSGAPVAVRADGTFEINGVVGTIRLRAAPPLPGWMVSAELLGDRDILDQPLTLREGDDIRGIRVIFSDALAELSGTVVAEDQRPAAGCTIAFFPTGGELGFDSRRARLERADQNGRFRLSDLISGSYLAAATPDIDAAIWMTADYLDRLRPLAQPMTLNDHEQKSVRLSCRPIQ